MDELFDVFDEKAPKASESGRKDKKNKKRTANGAVKSPTMQQNGDADGDAAMQDAPAKEDAELEANGDDEVAAGLRNLKRQRRNDEPDPVIADTFETEQSREVAAAAGLQSQKDDKAVVLSHQVRHQVSLPPDYAYIPISKHKAPETPARVYPFTLDPFQQVSISSI